MLVASSESMSSKGRSTEPIEVPGNVVPAAANAATDSAHVADSAPDVPRSMFDGKSFDTKLVPWHTLTIDDVKRRVVLPIPTHGVQSKNVSVRRETFGDNVIPTGSGPSIAKIIFANLVNSITLILGFVAAVSGYFQDWAAFAICIFVILFVGVIGVYQEWNAATTLDGLKSMTKGNAMVIRDGSASVISIDDVVIGDVVVLEQGTNVPADLRLIVAINLEIDEALLTGKIYR
jgi:magnesium-transporting ATPase (P-type)